MHRGGQCCACSLPPALSVQPDDSDFFFFESFFAIEVFDSKVEEIKVANLAEISDHLLRDIERHRAFLSPLRLDWGRLPNERLGFVAILDFEVLRINVFVNNENGLR